ncbi:MAG: GNAT family N-acetyltransferase [Sedimenticola sp.]
MQELLFRCSTVDDVDAMRSFLKVHGSNEWNYLPEEGVTKELGEVVEGKAVALIAELDNQMVGFAILYPRFNRFPEYTGSDISIEKTGYIGDVVVHRKYAGKGIGTKLMDEAKVTMLKCGVSEIYIDCHEENAASRGMARKARFKEVSLYFDPTRRSVGSCRTWVGLFSSTNSV